MTQQGLEQIIIGCKKGQERCFAQLVDIYSKRCFAYFYRLTGSAATSEDLLSELFVKLVEKIGTFRGGNFDGWLFAMASNIFYDHLRFKQRQTRLLDEQTKRARSQPMTTEEMGNDASDKLQNALGKLDDDVRELILMRYYSHLSFREISQTTAVPIGTILSKVHRGIKKLRELMREI
jgi:RNA polymerase sigma-70 factor (ECF subfamily)